MTDFKRLMSLLLALVLLAGMLPPTAVRAEEAETLPAETADFAFPEETTCSAETGEIPAGTESAEETEPVSLEAAASAAVTGTCGESLTWSYDAGSGILSISGSGDMADYVYNGPDTDYPWADYREAITLVEIGAGVASIGHSAFTGFSSLTGVSIPNTVTDIGSYAFEGCVSLQNVLIPGSVTSVGSSAFCMCSSLSMVTLSEGVETIGGMAFGAAGMDAITFPSSVTVIGSSAFGECPNLNAITFAGSAPSIAEDAFSNVEATVAYPEEDASWTEDLRQNYGGVLTWETNEEPQDPAAGFEYYYLGDGVLTISGSGAMPNYAYGESPWAAFAETATGVVIADSVTYIGDYAFCEFDVLTEVTVGANVTGIGQRAFGSCSSLAKVTFTGSAPIINASAFGAVDAVMWYPDGDDSWTGSVMGNYGGSLTWLCQKENISEGTAGNDIIWTLDGNGTLILSGSGTVVQNDGMSAVKDQVTAVVVDAGITGIGAYAFDGFSAITRVSLPEGLTSIGDYSFRNCTALTYLTIPAAVTAVGQFAFKGCTGLGSLVFRGTAPAIGVYAFSDCSLTVWYPENDDTWQGVPAAYGASKIYWTSGSPYSEDYYVAQGSFGNYMSWRLTDTGKMVISGFGPMTSSYSWPWEDHLNNIQSVEIRHGVTSVGGFRGCSNLTQISFADTVTEISGSAFYNCTALTDVVIPDTVTLLDDYAFYGCAMLRSVTVPGSVANIGEYAFAYCGQLTNLTLGEGIATLERGSFAKCTALQEVALPDSLVTISRESFDSCSELAEVHFGAGLKVIAQNAFKRCGKLCNVIFPDGLETISDLAFTCCDSLTAIHIPASVSFVAGGAFYDCPNLVSLTAAEDSSHFMAVENVLFSKAATTLHIYLPTKQDTSYTVPDGVTDIDYAAFRECTNLETVTAPEGLVSIGGRGFEGCTSLKQIDLPDSVTTIEYNAFLNCKALTAVLLSGVNSLGTSAFSGCTALASVQLSAQLETVPSSCFSGCSGLQEVSLPEGVTTIDNSAFNGCAALKEFNIPDTVTTVGKQAFSSCSNLGRVYFMGSAPTFGTNVFSSIYSPLTVYYPAVDTWTEAVRQSYGGSNVTWVSYDPAEGPLAADMAELEARIETALESGDSWFEVDFPVTLTHDLSIPAGLQIWIVSGGHLVIPDGVTLTLGDHMKVFDQLEIRSGGTLVIPETVSVSGFNRKPVLSGGDIVLRSGGTIDAPDGRVEITFNDNTNDSGIAGNLISGIFHFKTIADMETALETGKDFYVVSLHAPSAAFVLSRDLTLPANCSLSFRGNDQYPFEIPNGVTLTVNGRITADQSLRLGGTLFVGGRLDNNGVLGMTLMDGGSLVITGTFYNHKPLTFVSGSRLTNNGHILNFSDMTFLPGSFLTNNSQIILNQGTMYLQKGIAVTGNGRIQESGGVLVDESAADPELVQLYWGSEVTGTNQVVDINETASLQLSARVLPENASQKVTWSSSNAKVATVNEYGIVSFLAAGTVKITATTANKKSASVTIQTLAVPHNVGKPAEPAEDQPDLVLLAGKSVTLTAIDKDNDKALTSKQITWSMEDCYTPYAKLDAKGKLTAQKVVAKQQVVVVGTMVGNASIQVTYVVDIYPAVTTVELLQDDAAVNNKTVFVDRTGEPVVLTANTHPLDAMAGVSWSIGDKKEAFASYEIAGNTLTVTPKADAKPGNVTVKVTSDDGSKKTATVKLQFAVYAKTVTIDKSVTTLTAGDKAQQLNAAMEPEMVSKPGIVWSLKNPADKSYVNLSSGGKLTPKAVLAPVDVVIVATSKDGKASAEHTIRVLPKSQSQLVLMDENRNYVTKTTQTLDVNTQEAITLSAFTYGETEMTDVEWSPLTAKGAEITVNEGGSLTIRMLSAGNINVTAKTADGRKATVAIKGVKLAQGIEISQKKTGLTDGLEVASGKSIDLQATLTNAATKKVTWSITEGNAYAAIASSGKFTAAKDLTSSHKVVVRATAADGSGIYDDMEIMVRPIAQGVQVYTVETGAQTFSIDSDASWWVRSNTTLTWDLSKQEPAIALGAHVYPYYGEDDAKNAMQAVSFKSSTPKVADFVDGKLVIYKTGSTTITAMAEDGSKQKVTFKLNVVKTVTELTIADQTVPSGKSLNLAKFLTINPKDATNKKLTWEITGGSAYATISGSGSFKAKKVTSEQIVEVTVRSQDGGASTTFCVTITP